MTANFTANQMVEILRETTIALVRRDGADLTARQLGVLLICYLDDKNDHTVRGLALALDVSKPAITRALDRLTDLELVRRKTDPSDRRSVLVERTVKGDSFVRDLKTILATNAAAQLEAAASAPAESVRELSA